MLEPILQTPSAYGFQLASHVYRMLARCTVTLLSRMECAAERVRAIAEWLGRNDVIKARVLHPKMPENDHALALRVAERPIATALIENCRSDERQFAQCSFQALPMLHDSNDIASLTRNGNQRETDRCVKAR